jgi:hypothetical protein
MGIDWNHAPKGAEFFAYGKFRRAEVVQPLPSAYNNSKGWVKGIYTLEECRAAKDYQPRPTAQQWPEETRIDIIATNGNDGMHYDDIREQQTQSAAPLTNKYDRAIIGKYGTGKCVVDVYRVLNAFPTGSPEVDHALKKLLAAGKRGAKDELQDLREAVQSIEARIDYLMELGA